MFNTPIAMLLFSTALLYFLLGSWVILDSFKTRLNRVFFMTCLAVSGWAFVIGLAELSFAHTTSRGALSIGFGYLFGSLIPYLLYLTCRIFPEETTDQSVLHRLIFFACVASIILGFDGSIVRRMYIDERTSYYRFENGWGFYYFVAYVFTLGSLSARQVITKYKNSANRFRRLQLLYFGLGAGLSFFIALICNVFAPSLGFTSLSPYGAISPLIALGVLAFAITRHRLLDLRISLRWTVVLGSWVALLWVPLAVMVFLPSVPAFYVFGHKVIFLVILSLWATVFYLLCASTERELVRISGGRAYAYRDVEDEFQKILASVVSSSDVANTLVDLLLNTHDFYHAIIWHRREETLFEPLGSRGLPAPKVPYQAYLADIPCDRCEGRILDFSRLAESDDVPCPPDTLGIAVLIVLSGLSPNSVVITVLDSRIGRHLTGQEVRDMRTFASYAGPALKVAFQFDEIAETISALDNAKKLFPNSFSQTTVTSDSYPRTFDRQTSELRNLLEALIHSVSNQLTLIVASLRVEQIDKTLILGEVKTALDLLHASGSFLTYDFLETTVQSCDLARVLVDVLEQYKVPIRRKRVKVSSIPSLFLNADPLMIRYIFSNIIENAVKYVGDKEMPEIIISAEMASENLVVSVKDNGIGIPARELPRIVKPLQRGSRQLVRGQRVQGSGLGLSIVDRLVTRMGGRTLITSKEGIGTEVCVLLPFSLALPTHEAPDRLDA